MTLLILTETSAGYALFKAKDKKLLKRDNLAEETESAEGICSLLKLKQFQKFDSAASALEEVSALVEGKVTSLLASLLDSVKDKKKVSLAVADPKLGNAINKLPSISLTPISDSSTSDLYRAIRNHLPSLIPGLLPQDISTMSLGLSHSLSRHKLKFSPDKVDTMIVQAIALLDDLDKELNTYAMRVKEWYGWHFPEMGRIVNDNLAYAKVILKMGMRSNASNADLAEILPEEIEGAVKAAAEISMGTEITSEDLDNIQALAEQVVGFTEYRQQLSSYLSARMTAIAPNLTALVGELVGARLIAHAGSLLNLAKSPASTIQILGAEKALFRALKTKHDTPKYGLIYHASLIGQATGKNKGKIARMLATKAAIGLRVDALTDWSVNGEGNGAEVPEEEKAALGIESRAKIERRLRGLEGKPLLSRGDASGPNGKATSQPGKWEVKEARKYNPDADGLAGDEPAAASAGKSIRAAEKPQKSSKQNAKMITEIEPKGKSKKRGREEDEDEDEEDEDDTDEDGDEGEHADAVDEDEEDADDMDEDEDESETENEDQREPALPKQRSKSTAKATKGTVSQSPDQDGERAATKAARKTSKKAGKKDEEERASKRAKTDAKKSTKKLDPEIRAANLEDRKERRVKKRADKVAAQPQIDPSQHDELARQAGLSVSRFLKKYHRGEITWDTNGTPMVLSKKEKSKKHRTLTTADEGGDTAEADGTETKGKKKRKRSAEEAADEVDDAGRLESKKKKKKTKA